MDKNKSIKDLQEDVDKLRKDFDTREKKEIIREWLYTKCIWVWTILMGWCFAAGIFLAEHYDRVAIVAIAVFKALKDSGK